MSDAPERIWVQREFHEACVRGSACIHETARHAIGYIREDVHAAALVAKDAEIARLREALEPSGDTKGAYMGEIKDPETKRMVSWTAIKMIMAMISARAALNTQHEGETP